MNSQVNLPIFIEQKRTYGTSNTTNENLTLTPIVFCLHGKAPNVCCAKESVSQHCHRPRSEGVDKTARRKLIIASVLCVSFMILEIVGGVLSNSLAIATDAAHLLTDFASFMISLFSIWIAGRPSTKKMSFGWYRAEVMGALVSVLMIWVITAILVYLAIQRCITQEFEIDVTVMLITSFIAILVNLVMGWQLHPTHSHGGSSSSSAANSNNNNNNNNHHGHGHTGHGNSSTNTNNSIMGHHSHENINVRAAFIHVLGDVLQSVGVFIAAIMIYFKPNWQLADPICTFIFSIIVLFTTLAIMKDTILVLMEGTPSYLDYHEIMDIFMQIDGVVRVHNLRVWALSINKIALSAHLVIKSESNPEKILSMANTAIHIKYDFFETTLQIEEFRPEMEDCRQCETPSS